MAQGVTVPEAGGDRPRTVIAGVGGGGAGRAGFLALMYADFQAETDQPQDIGVEAAGMGLCQALGSDLDGPQGTPTMVRVLDRTAFVATVGAGLQQVDLDKVGSDSRHALTATVGRWTVDAAAGRYLDLSGGLRSVGVLPSSGASRPAVVLGGVSGSGVMAWKVAAGGLQQAEREAFPEGLAPSGALRMAVAPGYAYATASGEAKTTDLMLLAGGAAGLLVYDLGTPGQAFTLRAQTAVPLPGGAYDVAVDARRHLAYVACYTSGVAIVDLSDPYRHSEAAPFGMLDANRDGRDDRVLGYAHQASGSRTTLVVDSETGLLFIGEQGTSSGMKAVGAQRPRMEFLLNKSVPPGQPEQFEVPGYLDAFAGDKPRLGVWLPGGAGPQLQAQLELYDRKGLPAREHGPLFLSSPIG